MSLSTGTRIGPYEIVSALGAGGMGEVYRARDTKLDRDVALKILPESFASDPDRLMRFEREAKTLAALNHPNIAQVFGVEDQGATRALVMEFVEGEDLSAHIARGPIAWTDALPVAKQIAEALEAAHDAGIIHRDLKPSNIRIKAASDIADGIVKVLDFGLAKALDSGPGTKSGPGIGDSAPTMTSPAMTATGVILGTAAYMSPEQAKGRPVDRRTDIWAFGVVLFEMLSGRLLFKAETVSETMAAVLRGDIDLAALPESTPPAIRRLLARCLDRDPKTRLRDIGEARIALSAPLEPAGPPAPTVAAWWRRPLVVAILVGAAALIAGALGANALRPAPAPGKVARFELPAAAESPVWSPDGSQIAWLARESAQGPRRAFLRRRDAFQVQAIDTGEGRREEIAFSPDGEWIAFTHAPEGDTRRITEIRKVRVTGGPSERIATVALPPFGTLIGLGWQAGRVWLAAGHNGLWAVPEAGGELQQVLALEGKRSAWGPIQAVNNGRDLLFIVQDPERTRPEGEQIWDLWTMPLAGGEPRLVLPGVLEFSVTSMGHLVYEDSDTRLKARRFDERTLGASGDAVPVIEPDVSRFALSSDGTLAYTVRRHERQEPVWFDRSTGHAEPINMPARVMQGGSCLSGFQLSPDAAFLLVAACGPLWAWDLARQSDFQIAADVRSAYIARQTQAIFFQKDSRTDREIFRVDFPWTSPPVQVTRGNAGRLAGVSPDGQRLVVSVDARFRVIRTDGTGTAADFTDAPILVPGFSPNGRWVAYQAGSARPWELWVRPEPEQPNGQRLVGRLSSRVPFWSHDGRELVYQDERSRWVSVTVRALRPDAAWELGRPVDLNLPEGITPVAVPLDGTRLLATRPLPQPPPTLAIVTNFFEELRAKVPVK